MAGGAINGFFRRALKGGPLRALANVRNFNRVANILEDISGEGCEIDKPLDGSPWVVRYTGNTSSEKPLVMPMTVDVSIGASNDVKYNTSTGNVEPVNVDVLVNGIAASAYDTWTWGDWTATPGVKWLHVWQYFGQNQKDANGQFVGNPSYKWGTNFGAGIGPVSAEVARIPYCRVEAGATQNDPPVVRRLVEGTVRVWCHRGDSQRRTFPYTTSFVAYANARKSLSRTTDTNGDNLPIAVRNLTAAADGFYDEYPNGRYYIDDGDVVWRSPDATAAAKNAAKALLLRYLDPDNLVTLAEHYWRSISDFVSASASAVHELVGEYLEDEDSELYRILVELILEVWQGGPFQLRCPDEDGDESIVAAVVNRSGEWVPILTMLVSSDEYDVSLGDYDDLLQAVNILDSQLTADYAHMDGIIQSKDQIDLDIAAFVDYSQDVSGISGDADDCETDVLALDDDFSALEQRIAALERRS